VVRVIADFSFSVVARFFIDVFTFVELLFSASYLRFGVGSKKYA